MNSNDQIPEVALKWADAGMSVALATVIRTWGSAPRPVGAQLVISDDERFQGSVSGGCVEGAVIHAAKDAIETGECLVMEFGVSDQNAFDVGLACGGEIDVLVEPVGLGQGPSVDDIRELVSMRSGRVPVVWEINLSTWERRLRQRDDGDDALKELFRTDNSRRDGDLFQVVHNPPLRLVVVGAVHIAQPLVRMAKIAGYDVVLCDPRERFASAERFPEETFLEGWPDEALTRYGIDARTAVVALCHDPKIDQPALEVALKSEAFYIGALGSKRTHARRVDELTKAGFSVRDIDRISGPIGLDIGASSPAEIAISIIAEMTEQLRQPIGADQTQS